MTRSTSLTSLTSLTSRIVSVSILMLSLCASRAGVASARAQGQSDQETRIREIADQNERFFGYHGTVSGRVTFEDGKPVPGLVVRARFKIPHSLSPGEGSAVTDADGRYTIRGLRSEAFFVTVPNRSGPYLMPAAREINGEAHETNIDFILRLGPRITVRVRDAETDKPIPGLIVKAGRSGYTKEPSGETDANGILVFRVGELETEVSIEPPEKDRSHIGAAPGFEFAHGITLKDVQDVVWDVKTYSEPDTHVERTFSGTVTGPDGKPVAGARVQFFESGGESPQSQMTDPNGRFSFTGWRLRKYAAEHKGLLLRVEKDGVILAKFPAPEEMRSQIPIQLPKAGGPTGIYGRLVDTEGKPLARVHVDYDEHFGSDIAQPWVALRDAGLTDDDGNFRIAGLSPDANYILRLGDWPRRAGTKPYRNVYFPSGWRNSEKARMKFGEMLAAGTITVGSASEDVSRHARSVSERH